LLRGAIAAFCVFSALGAGKAAQACPAKLTVQNTTAVGICYTNESRWDLKKEGTLSNGTVNYTVTATKVSTSNNVIEVVGVLDIINNGGEAGTIGNVIISLQKAVAAGQYTSAGAVVADATQGDAATSGNLVTLRTLYDEQTRNSTLGANNYTVTGSKATYTETAGSGELTFFDPVTRAEVDLRKPITLAAYGGRIRLLFTASFDNSVLNIAPGTPLLVLAIVSFDNAVPGLPGVVENLDVNGNGIIDPKEALVGTTVLARTTRLPALIECNKTVTLTDKLANVTATGTVTFGNFRTNIGGGTGTEVISGTVTRTVSVDVTPGATGGTIENCAKLTSKDVVKIVNVRETNGTLTPFSFICCEGLDTEACATVEVKAPPKGTGPFRTQTQGGWGAKPSGNNPGAFLAANFSTVFPNGIVIGSNGPGCNTLTFTSALAVQNFLPQGGTPGVLKSSATNPTSRTSAGVFAGQVLALQISVGFSEEGVTRSGLADLKLQSGELAGKTVGEVLALANEVIGCGTSALPSGLTVSELNAIVSKINENFVDGTTDNGFLK
ncbi:MAG TPA: hypothetical protein VK689_04985, partial [Armatimonadota bacterium]|nr:hypothetical protein [Armatimonadota bacterium]